METLLHPTGSKLECTPSNWFFQETDCFQINSFSQLNDELIQEILNLEKEYTAFRTKCLGCAKVFRILCYAKPMSSCATVATN